MVTEKDIYKFFSEIYYKHEPREYKDDEVHVTEAIQCLLKSFYQRKLKRELYDSKIVVLSFGTLIHEALQDVLKKRGYALEVEGRKKLDGVILYAHADALHDDHILEFKTITRFPSEPLNHHKLQLNAYLHIFNKPIGYLVYVHKPSGTVKVYNVTPNETSFKYICLRASRLVAHLKSNKMPEPEPSWLCDYCEYVDVCPNPKIRLGRRVM